MTHTITYHKRREYWMMEAKSPSGEIVATLEHLEGESRPYLICNENTERFCSTYSEACSVFMNILRQGR